MSFNPEEMWSEDSSLHRLAAVLGSGRQKRRQGSLEDTIAQQTLPTGPSSVEELFSFPEQLLDVVFAREGYRSRIMNLLSDGLHLSTDYSGVCAEREALRLMSLAVQKRTGVMLPQKLGRTCDIDSAAQKVLCHLSDRLDDGESCVFDDIHKQLVPLAQSWISQCDLGRCQGETSGLRRDSDLVARERQLGSQPGPGLCHPRFRVLDLGFKGAILYNPFV